jgi:hypothetical protein
MPNPIVFISHFKVKEGKLDATKLNTAHSKRAATRRPFCSLDRRKVND